MNTQNDSDIMNFWRFLDLAECKCLPVGRRAEVYDARNNRIAHVKITSVHTWVTRPNNCEIGWKYGLYEYGKVKIDQYHGNDFFVVRKNIGELSQADIDAQLDRINGKDVQNA